MSKKTVYVVGAGASFEIGLPTGEKLKEHISDLLDMKFDYRSQVSGDNAILQALRNYTSNDRTNNILNEYIRECRHISENMPLAISIDNFIDSERGNEKLALCGKISIVRSILESERNSKIFLNKNDYESSFDFSSLEKTWYLSFFRSLTENCNIDDLAERLNKITLIIFNYDRCIEHFLIHGLMSYYGLDKNTASKILESLCIIHPYGTIGTLPWQDQTSSTSVDFGGSLQSSQLIDYAQRIRTFTEGAHSVQMEQLIQCMCDTSRLVFLGFAFHKLNMKLLGGNVPDGYANPNLIDCFATAFETSKSDQESIRNSINYLYNKPFNINLENSTCCQIFSDYSRSLGYS